MKKRKPKIVLTKNYFEDPDFVTTRNLAETWAAGVQLNPNPEIPPELWHDPRVADKCRPLISIADSLGRGAETRAALVEFCAGMSNTDVGIEALEDIRRVWMAKPEHLFTLGSYDRISNKNLVAGVIEANPAVWANWRGRLDKGELHELRPRELISLLSSFGIMIKTIWPMQRRPGDKPVRGWRLDQFEKAWQEHLSGDVTPKQSNKIILLRKP
jgi:hypothetical protein